MRYTMPVRVRYSETDQKGHVHLHIILEYFQDCCIFQSEALGYGVQTELKQHRGWFLLAWNVKIRRYPSLGECLQIVTEPYKMKGFFGYRRFMIIDEQEEIIAEADSLWLLMDLEKMLPLRVPIDMINAYISEVKDDTIRVKRKLPVDGDWVPQDRLVVPRYSLDSNSHVNNTCYAMWAEQWLPEDFPVRNVKIDYRQASYENDVISIDTIVEENCIRYRFRSREDILLALVTFYR